MSECVKVVVRCRPLNEREQEVDVVVAVNPHEGQVVLRQPNPALHSRYFTFDKVFSTEATNESVYAESVHPLVESVLLGYNGCVFAFGQTSCGKTFSMQGIADSNAQRGVMPRCFEQIFDSIQKQDVSYYSVRTSYLEIYNEEIRDLLHKHNMNKLDVKEHPDKGVYVRDLTTVEVTCVEDMEEVLEVGSWNRVLGATDQNPDSSRSHCIFTVEFKICFYDQSDSQEHFRSGRLNLVDLAGSERQRHSRSEGERFREATKINLSLSALGNVISALVNNKSKHIPYRASKLTRLLQDSLGGNSRTLMIACVSPGENNYGETLSTLRYANRAKNIENRPRVNEDPKDAMLRQYQKEIKELRELLAKQIRISGDSPVLPLVPSTFEDHPEPRAKSTVVVTKHERLAYEQQISGLQHKFDREQLTREQYETSLKNTRSDFEKYRLEHEYKVQRLRSEYKTKINKLETLLRSMDDISSEESAYVSLTNETEQVSSSTDSDKQDKGTLLMSSAEHQENSHLWSYQWLKCYCDTNGRQMNRNLFTSTEDQFQCICSELIKREGFKNNKSVQTCQRCMKRNDDVVVTSQPLWSQNDDEKASFVENHQQPEEEQRRQRNGVCCAVPFVSFFGETRSK